MTDTETLWREFRAPLAAFVRRRVANAQDAEDLVAEVFARLLEHVAEIEHVDDVRAWLYRVARNAIIDHRRRARPAMSLEATSEPADLHERPDDDANELAGCMERMLQSLPEVDRQALHAIASGCSQEQLAEREGLSASGGRSRVQRARVRLMAAFRACCQVELDGVGRIVDWRRHGCSDRRC